MRPTKTTYLLFIFFISLVLNVNMMMMGVTNRLDQKKGLWQSQTSKQIKFTSYQKVDFDFTKVPLKHVMKMIMFDDKIFILDGKRNEIFVIDRTGKHLYTVGRPGQGPGDIEYGWDFSLCNNKIYVLNSLSRRISVFKIDGTPFETIRLEYPGNSMAPTSIEVDKNQNIIIGTPFDPIITIFSPKGAIIKTFSLITYIESYKETPKIGIPSSLKIYGDTLYHFDMFKGVVSSINPSGKIDYLFSAYNQYNDKMLKDVLEDSKNDQGKTVIADWTHFCFDDSGKIYTLSKLEEEGKPQEMFVFSKEGDFLYSQSLDFFKTSPVRQFSIYRDKFAFLTKEFDLYIAK